MGSTGTLSLVNGGGTTLTSLTLAGTYTTADFTALSDGRGGTPGTLIDVLTPPPPGTTCDMILRNGTNGDYEIYDIGNNAILAAYPLGQIGLSSQVVGVGGFNGSDTTDMMLRNTTTGTFTIYDISGNTITGSAAIGTVGLEWTVACFGDFSGNPGETDMLMRNSNTGAFEVYDISNNAITSGRLPGHYIPREYYGIAMDGCLLRRFFSGNPGESDLLLRATSGPDAGDFEVYDISHNAVTSMISMGAVGLEWTVACCGDFSGNANETDILMRNSNAGDFEVYDISHNAIASAASMGQVGLEWTVAGFGDFSGNAGETDMLMRKSNTGAFEVYDISHNTITSASSMGSVGLEWQVGGIAADPPTGRGRQQRVGRRPWWCRNGAASTSDHNAALDVRSAGLGAAVIPISTGATEPPTLSALSKSRAALRAWLI